MSAVLDPVTLSVFGPLVLLYAAFLFWWGGHGQPMSAAERDALLRELTPAEPTEHDLETLAGLRTLMETDDGKSFIMQNLVLHRPKALYPPGLPYGDDAKAADQRYGKAVLWPLLKNGNLMLFVARRSGRFIDPEHAVPWHYVAMVRYRSRRDMLRFAIDSNRGDIFIHKWAAIETTHVFPVKPIVNLMSIPLLLATVLFSVGALLSVALH